MGIQKAKILPSGVGGDYWRITNINIDRQTFKAIGEIALFKDKAASAAGSPPIGCYKSFSFTFVVSDLTSSSNLITWVYNKIKAQAEAVVSYDLSGNPITPRAADPDIAGGVDQ